MAEENTSKPIPKVAAFFWGNKELSWLRYMTLYSFCHLNPAWDIYLFQSTPNDAQRFWVDSVRQDFSSTKTIKDYSDRIADLPIKVVPWEMPPSKLKDVDYWNKLGPSHKSNFFKWQWLSENAGIYADMDILFVKPMDSFLSKISDSDVAICHNSETTAFPNGYFSIGLLGSCGNCTFYSDILEKAFEVYTPVEYQSVGVLALYRMLNVKNKSPYDVKTEQFHFQDMVAAYPHHKFYNIPMRTVYPWPHSLASSHIFERFHKTLPEECVGLHWYAGAPISQRFNQFLTKDNYHNKETTLSHFIDRIYQ